MGLFRSSSTCLGIDLGGRFTKAVVVERGKNGPMVRHAVMITTPEGALDAGVVAEPGRAGGAIKEGIVGAGMKAQSLVVGTGVSGLVIREFLTERTTDKEKAIAAIKRHKDLNLPQAAIQGTQFDIHVLEPDSSDDEMKVVLVWAKKSAVINRQKAFRAAGLGINVVDADALALANAFHACYPEREYEPTVLLNIGHQMSFMLLMSGGVPIFFKYFTTGTDSLVAKIERSGGVMAGENLQDVVLKGDMHAMYADSFESWLEELGGAVARSVKLTSIDGSTASLVLSGGGALIPGVQEALGKRVTQKVELFDPFAVLAVDKSVDPALREKGPFFAIALGLALRGDE